MLAVLRASGRRGGDRRGSDTCCAGRPCACPAAAGLACGVFKDPKELAANWSVDKTWEPQMQQPERERLYRQWKKAVTRSFDWIDDEEDSSTGNEVQSNSLKNSKEAR